MSVDRRGFFSKVGSIFSREGDLAFFGAQFVINVYGEDTLRSKLHRVMESGGAVETPDEKRSYYKRIAALLREDLPFLEYGYWDLIAKKGEAETEFNQWVTQISASMATEEEELGAEIDEVHRLSNDKSYVAVTLLFLLANVDELLPFFDKINEIEEEEYYSKFTFSKLIDAITYINFEYSFGDASFIMPGSEEDGISWEDIRSEGWDYLQPVM